MNALVDNLKNDLAYEITKTYDDFISSFQLFSNELINAVPFTGSWTAGQVADHIIKSTSAVPDIHTEEAKRDFDEKVSGLRSVFLDFSIKMKSPDFVLPSEGPFDKIDLLGKLTSIKHANLQKIRETDLFAVCTDFEFPVSGTLTRYEWLKFFVYHCQRHNRQLMNIYAALNN